MNAKESDDRQFSKSHFLSMNRLRTLIVILSLGLVGVACVVASLADMPPWFAEAVYIGAGYIVVSLIALSLVGRFLTAFSRGQLMRVFLLAITAVAAIVPTSLVIEAAFWGHKRADFQTWHLLGFFLAMYQVGAVVIAATLAGSICLVIALYRYSRARPPRKSRDQPSDTAALGN